MEWRPVVGFEGYLEVSDEGYIRRTPRLVNHRWNSKMLLNPKTLARYTNRKGYYYSRTEINCKSTHICIHKAVAEAFIPNPENKPQIDHIDGDKSNNKVSNLRWVTNRENYDYSVELGLRVNSYKALEEHRHDPVRVQKVKENNIKNGKKNYCYTDGNVFVAEYPSYGQAARAVGTTPSHVRDCCVGKRKSCKGFVFSTEPINGEVNRRN